MILSVKNLTKIYEDKTVVDNVEFELEKGKMLCILGPSGCGKSTILNMIGGFVKPNSGQIILDGEDITNLTAEKKRYHYCVSIIRTFLPHECFQKYCLRFEIQKHGQRYYRKQG